jgi:hypothetical protein
MCKNVTFVTIFPGAWRRVFLKGGISASLGGSVDLGEILRLAREGGENCQNFLQNVRKFGIGRMADLHPRRRRAGEASAENWRRGQLDQKNSWPYLQDTA